MGRLIVSEFMTLDGVAEAPGHEEHRDGRNAWALAGTTEDQLQYKIHELDDLDALLLGRVTYQIWEAFWPTAPTDNPLADRINSMRKYVVSKTVTEARWTNTVILSQDIPQQVAGIKQDHEGDILIGGSVDLVNSLMPHGLIDEFRLIVFPVVLGSGKRLFRDEMGTSHLRLTGTRAFASGGRAADLRTGPRSPDDRVRGGIQLHAGAGRVHAGRAEHGPRAGV